MKLSIINFRNNYNIGAPSLKQSALSFKARADALNPDVFERTNSGDSSRKDLLTEPKQFIVKQICESGLDRNCFLGVGSEASVYRIKGTPYCVRFPRGVKKLAASRMSTNLTEKDRINHVVAKFQSGIKIMNTIEGTSLASSGRSFESLKKTSDDVVKLPVSAFHGLFKQVCHAKDNDMIFDCSPMNVILNSEKKTLCAIDFYEMHPDYPEIVKPLRHMYEALRFKGNEEKIAGLIMLGALEELKPSHKPCLSISEFNFQDFMRTVDASLSRSLPNDWTKLREILTEIECLKMKELLGLNNKDILAFKINEAKGLICENLLMSSQQRI